MSEWIQENGLTILLSLLGAGGWLGFFLNRYYERKKEKGQSIKELRNEIKDLESELSRFKEAELSEKSIDKSQGTIYYEKFDDGKSRTICGFCWEKDHIKIPVIPHLEYDEDLRQDAYWARCQNCGKACTFFDQEPERISEIEDDCNLPF